MYCYHIDGWPVCCQVINETLWPRVEIACLRLLSSQQHISKINDFQPRRVLMRRKTSR
jgi:hypothetical protein